jgi:hypothetical protein
MSRLPVAARAFFAPRKIDLNQARIVTATLGQIHTFDAIRESHELKPSMENSQILTSRRTADALGASS